MSARVGAGDVVRSVLAIGAAAVLVAYGLPWAAHTTWSEIGAALGQVHLAVALGLLAVTVLALYGYTWTLTGSLPGLTHPQGLMVNVIGSAAGNLLPGGGAVGSAATFAVYRSWGFSATAISTSLVVTGVWNVAARMLLPVIGIGALVLTNQDLPRGVAGSAGVGVLVAAALLAVFAGIVSSDAFADRAGRALQALVGPVLARFGRTPDVVGAVRGLRSTCAAVVRTGWRSMTFGVVSFLGIQCVLFGLCLRATGATPTITHVVAAFAIGRLLSAVGITPGGLGVAEAGTTAALVALGEPHAASAAGVLLFTCYSHLAELPLGAVGFLGWRWSLPWYTARHPAAAQHDPA